MARSGINKVILVGNLGGDPEIKYLPNGDAVATFSIATGESWNDKQSGEKVEKTEWHRIVAFRKLGEICGEYLKKGSKVFIEGKLQTRKWQDKDGRDCYTTEINAFDMQMLDSRNANASEPQSKTNHVQPSTQSTQPQNAQTQPQAQNGQVFDDDIPF